MTLQEIHDRAKVVHGRRKKLINAFLDSDNVIYKGRCQRLIEALDSNYSYLEHKYDMQRREETRQLKQMYAIKKELAEMNIIMENVKEEQ